MADRMTTKVSSGLDPGGRLLRDMSYTARSKTAARVDAYENLPAGGRR